MSRDPNRPIFDPEDPLVELKKKAYDLDASNGESYAELCRLYPPLKNMNTDSIRMTVLIEYLHKIGVVTEEDQLNMQIEFMEVVKVELDRLWEQHHAQKSKRLLIPNQQPQVMLGPDGRPLT